MALATIKTVEKLSDLIALDPADSANQNVEVLGRDAPGDGYGGLFIRDDDGVAANSALDPEQGIFVESTPKIDQGWKRELKDNFLTPYMFGGKRDVTKNATDAVQAMITFARQFNTGDGFQFSCGLAGRMWKVFKSINATDIDKPGFWIGDGGLFASLSSSNIDEIVLDLAGTNSPILSHLKIYGSKNNPPAVGIYYGRLEVSPTNVPIAPNAKLTNVRISGFFSKACIVNFASETSSEVNCHYYNEFHNNLVNPVQAHQSFAAIYTDNMTTLDEKIGGLTSKYQTLPTIVSGNHSNVLHYTSQCHAQRPSDVQETITSISQTNPAVITFTDVSDLESLDKLYIHKLDGSLGDEVNHKCFEILNVSPAETTVIINADFSSLPNYISGGLARNVTDPAILIAGTKSFHGRAGYLLTYGSPSVIFDCVNGSALRQFDLSFQQEDNPDKPLKFFIKENEKTLVQGFSVELLSNNQAFETGVFEISGAEEFIDTGTIEFQNFNLRIDSLKEQNSSPKIFDPSRTPTEVTAGFRSEPKRVVLQNATIEVPQESILNNVADFHSFSGITIAHDTDVKKGQYVFDSMDFIASARDRAPLRIIAEDNNQFEGPFIDTVRQSNSPNSNDLIGGYRYVGNDTAGNEQVYALTQGRILNAETSGEPNASGALDIFITDDKNIEQVAEFSTFGGTDDQTALFLRYQTDIGVTQKFERVLVGPAGSAGSNFRSLRVPN